MVKVGKRATKKVGNKSVPVVNEPQPVRGGSLCNEPMSFNMHQLFRALSPRAPRFKKQNKAGGFRLLDIFAFYDEP